MGVRAGQVWADNDRRSKGRLLRVLSVSDGTAACQVIRDRDNPAVLRGRYNAPRPAGWTPIGYVTTIRIDRMRPTSTGYRLQATAEQEDAA